MKENWIPWKIIELQGRYSYMSSIKDDSDGFRVSILVEDDVEVEIYFEDGVLVYQCLEENFFLDRIYAVRDKYGKGYLWNNRFFIIEDSTYLEELEKKCLGIYEKDKLRHYVIVDSDYTLDIVCTPEPKITIRNLK